MKRRRKARSAGAGDRERRVAAREVHASRREKALEAKEQLLRLRDESLRAREAEARGHVGHEGVLAEVNRNLVLAALRAQNLADAAERARAEMAASEERFRSLVTASSAVVFRADAEGRIAIDPARWTELTGLDLEPGEEAPGWGWLRAVHPDDREQAREAWSDAVRQRRAYDGQHRLRRRDGSDAWVAVRAVPIPEGSAEVREWIGMMTDISDRVRIDEAREQFIAMLGHDLRNPVASILLAADQLGRDTLPPRIRDAAERIARSARRMEAMIANLLDFARGRLGRGIPVTPSRCDLGRISAESVAGMAQAYPERRVSCEIAGDVAGEWDADRLEQVLSNLIGNAIQHGRDPIAVAVRDAGGEVILSVHNAGDPIPPETIPRLFEPFRATSRERGEGLGLGLFIVSEIVRAHGGEISVSSSADEGTTFTIRLPRRPPALRPAGPAGPAPPPA